MFQKVITYLVSWRSQPDAGEANSHNLLKEIDDAIGCLKLCEKYHLHAGSKVTVIPFPQNRTPSSEFRLIEDQETESREHWIEVFVNGQTLRPLPGSVIVEP
jgi:hypothetical protein